MRTLLPVILLLISLTATAAGIPLDAKRWQRELTHVAHQQYGLGAPTATLAALIHQESRWQAGVVSPAGAQGLAQFMPATANWMPSVFPQLQTAAPFDPRWSIRAMVLYTVWINDRVTAEDNCEQWAFILSAYNGGLGWVNRDKQLAKNNGANPYVFFGEVERFNAGRSTANFTENRNYAHLILRKYSNDYYRADWRLSACEAAKDA